jgi:hypothetical protein
LKACDFFPENVTQLESRVILVLLGGQVGVCIIILMMVANCVSYVERLDRCSTY